MSNIIIPMLVQAYASGSVRPSQKDIPVMAPNYKTALFTSVLGSQNTPGVAETAPPLKAGIHLHFILPDAFTHSPDGQDYPAVPNRFVVTRLWRDESSGRLLTKIFVVESDFISTDKVYENSVTFPFFNDPDERKRWRYLGRNYPAGKRPAAAATDAYLDKLTAVGPGDPLFAAYYPNCASVFGFYDALTDLPLAPSIDMTYFVMGYFSLPAANPFFPVETEEDFARVMDEMRLSTRSPAPRDDCLLYGSVGAIEWKGFDAEYCPAPQGKVNVVFGNTSAEALSATVKNSLKGEDAVSERMLTALQYELYDETESLDANFKIDDEIHLQSFSRLDGFDENLHVSVDKNTALPPGSGMGAEYTALKKLGGEIGARKRSLAFERKKLFVVWEQYVLLHEKGEEPQASWLGKERLLEEIRSICAGIETLEADIQEKTADHARKSKAFSASLPEGADCEKGGNTAFFAAKDPVLLLSGPGIKRSFAYGEDGRFTANGFLPCQSAPVSAKADAELLLRQCFSGLESLDSLPPSYSGLLLQTALVCPKLLAAVEAVMGEIATEGEAPCEIAINRAPFDWTALFMIWGLAYHPTRTAENPDDTLAGWHLEYGDTNLVYTGGLKPEQIESRRIAGKMVLTPHAVKTFGNVMKRYGELYGDEEKMKEIAARIKDLPVISQNLSGFSDYFSGFRQALQFPILGIGEDPGITQAVAGNIDGERSSIAPDSRLMPLRGGYVKLTDLSLVSSFGQTQILAQSSYYNGCEVDFAETVASGNKDFGLLTPSFTVSARLNADFVSAKDKEIFTSVFPETSPVCGILIPERLNRRLLAYTAEGRYLGMVKTVVRDKNPTARWLSAPGLPPEFERLEIPNDDFKRFLKRLLDDDGAFYEFNGLMDRYLDVKHNFASLVWGRPLVLARSRLEFEFFGGPQFSKRLEDFGKYDSHGAEDIRFQLRLGDMGRVADGLLGYFEGNDFTKIYPPYGAKNPCGTENYVQYAHDSSLARADGGRYFTLLLEPDAPVHIQTGILPVKTLAFEAAHAETADGLALSAEIAPVLAAWGEAGLPPLPLTEKDEIYTWNVLDNEDYVTNRLVPPTVSFEETLLMDGLLVKARK
jgi:hypothetical protein